MSAPLLAWVAVIDDDGCSELVFAPTEDAAIARFDADCPPLEVYRDAQFDRFAPGPVPIEAFQGAGWWWTCSRCDEPSGSWRTVDGKAVCTDCLPDDAPDEEESDHD